MRPLSLLGCPERSRLLNLQPQKQPSPFKTKEGSVEKLSDLPREVSPSDPKTKKATKNDFKTNASSVDYLFKGPSREVSPSDP